VDILWQLKKQRRKKWTDSRQLRKKAERRADWWEAAQKQSKKKWTDGRQLRNKEERSGQMRGS
jgi:hypothetical protein